MKEGEMRRKTVTERRWECRSKVKKRERVKIKLSLKVTKYSYFIHKMEHILFINHSRKSIFTQPKSI